MTARVRHLIAEVFDVLQDEFCQSGVDRGFAVECLYEWPVETSIVCLVMAPGDDDMREFRIEIGSANVKQLSAAVADVRQDCDHDVVPQLDIRANERVRLRTGRHDFPQLCHL